MKRVSALLLALAAGCATEEEVRPESPLRKLRAKTNAYASFHYKGELTDGSVVVPIELAWRAPDRALLRYGPNHTTVLAGGVARHVERKNYSSVNFLELLDGLRRSYGDLLSSAPEPAFTLGGWELPLYGRGLQAAVEYRLLGSRLGWLDELAGYIADGPVYRKGAIEVELREDGFIQRAKVASTATFELKELTIDRPLDDSLFAPPAPDGCVDISDGRRNQGAQELEEAFHRWVLASKADDETLEALVRVDLARAYEPAKMIEFQKKNLDDDVEAFRKRQPDGAGLRERIDLARDKAIAALKVVEEDVRKEFRQRLDRAVSPRRAQALAGRWLDAVSDQFDVQIRRPIDRVFVEKLRE